MKITVHMDEEFYKQLQAAATAKELTLSQYGLSLLEKAYAEECRAHEGSASTQEDVLETKYNHLSDYQTNNELACKASVETLVLVRKLLQMTNSDERERQHIFSDAKQKAKRAIHWFRSKK